MLRDRVKTYWLVSSYWNGRIESEEVPTASGMMKFIQKQMLTNLDTSTPHYPLANLWNRLLDEVIRHGRKKFLSQEVRGNVVQLRQDVVIIDSLTELSEQIMSDVMYNTQQ